MRNIILCCLICGTTSRTLDGFTARELFSNLINWTKSAFCGATFEQNASTFLELHVVSVESAVRVATGLFKAISRGLTFYFTPKKK